MKGPLLLLFIMWFCQTAMSQDIVILRGGEQIHAKVTEVTADGVTCNYIYHKDTAAITIKKSVVRAIEFSGALDYHRVVPGRHFVTDLRFGVCNASNSDAQYSTAPNYCFFLSFLGAQMFNQHIGIEEGLGLEAFNYDEASASPQLPANDVFHVVYFTVPLRVVYFSNSVKETGFYAIAGCDFSCFPLADEVGGGGNMSRYYSKTMVSSFAGAGVEFRGKAGYIWMFGLYWKRSLNNLYSGKTDGSLGLSPGNAGFMQCLGLNITLMGLSSSYR